MSANMVGLAGPAERSGWNAELGEDVLVFANAVLGKPPVAPARTIARQVRASGAPVRVGRNSVIGCNVVIYENVTIGENCLIGDGAVIRENTTIGDHCIVGMYAIVSHDVTIGNRSRVGEHCFVVGYAVVGSDVFIGPGVKFANDPAIGRGPTTLKGPVIEDRARLGLGAMVLPGVVVGEDSLVGAGALVTRDVPAGVVVMGCPARVVRGREAEERPAAQPVGRASPLPASGG
jgi:acetyltransferase-like isoleucine patch superfamily enzyme